MSFLKHLVVVCLLFISFKTFAWGQIGHRIVGQIASENLSKKAKKEIEKILGSMSLAESTTWADEIKSDSNWDRASYWHYVTIPDGETYFSRPRSQKGDLIEALCRMEDSLRNSSATDKEKLEALKFIVHLMGDLHMPLHVGKPEDRGGNDVKVKWFNVDRNLHAVWDEDMVEFEKFSYSEYSKILNNYSKAEKKEWAVGTYLDWALETMALRNSVYPADPNLGYKYHYQFKPVLRSQLKKAGFRLATILNNVFEKNVLTKEEVELREKIKTAPMQ